MYQRECSKDLYFFTGRRVLPGITFRLLQRRPWCQRPSYLYDADLTTLATFHSLSIRQIRLANQRDNRILRRLAARPPIQDQVPFPQTLQPSIRPASYAYSCHQPEWNRRFETIYWFSSKLCRRHRRSLPASRPLTCARTAYRTWNWKEQMSSPSSFQRWDHSACTNKAMSCTALDTWTARKLL